MNRSNRKLLGNIKKTCYLHAAVQGAMTAADGGNFWSGAAAGAFGSITSHGLEAMGVDISKNCFATVAFSTFSGGMGSVMAGGDFWKGAESGFIVGAFNAVNHSFEGRAHRYLTKKINAFFKNVLDYDPSYSDSDNNNKARAKEAVVITKIVVTSAAVAVVAPNVVQHGVKHVIKHTLYKYYVNRAALHPVTQMALGAVEGYTVSKIAPGTPVAPTSEMPSVFDTNASQLGNAGYSLYDENKNNK